MKKQTIHSVQGHLIRREFYLLLLLAVCAIPFTLAQRNVAGQSAANRGSADKRFVRRGKALPADIIVVTNTNDSGPGSLRDALTVANDGDTINFDSSLKGQTITLTSG